MYVCMYLYMFSVGGGHASGRAGPGLQLSAGIFSKIRLPEDIPCPESTIQTLSGFLIKCCSYRPSRSNDYHYGSPCNLRTLGRHISYLLEVLLRVGGGFPALFLCLFRCVGWFLDTWVLLRFACSSTCFSRSRGCSSPRFIAYCFVLLGFVFLSCHWLCFALVCFNVASLFVCTCTRALVSLPLRVPICLLGHVVVRCFFGVGRFSSASLVSSFAYASLRTSGHQC